MKSQTFKIEAQGEKQTTKLPFGVVIETTYEIKKAHNQMGACLYEGQTLKGVIRFLKKEKVPFNFDVKVMNFDGNDWEFNTYTGDTFLEMATKYDDKAPKK